MGQGTGGYISLQTNQSVWVKKKKKKVHTTYLFYHHLEWKKVHYEGEDHVFFPQGSFSVLHGSTFFGNFVKSGTKEEPEKKKNDSEIIAMKKYTLVGPIPRG